MRGGGCVEGWGWILIVGEGMGVIVDEMDGLFYRGFFIGCGLLIGLFYVCLVGGRGLKEWMNDWDIFIVVGVFKYLYDSVIVYLLVKFDLF